MDENKALIEISQAEQALQRASDIQEILILRDQASAFQVFANAQGFREAAQKAKIYQLKAERKAGDWLSKNVVNPRNLQSQDATEMGLPDGVDKYESSRWQMQASLPEEKFNEWVDECLAYDKEISAYGLRREAMFELTHRPIDVSTLQARIDNLRQALERIANFGGDGNPNKVLIQGKHLAIIEIARAALEADQPNGR